MKRFGFVLITFALLLFFVAVHAEEYYAPATQTEIHDEIRVFFEEDNDAKLAEKYIRNIMPHKKILQVSRPSGLMLPESCRSLYVALQKLVSEVAAGERSNTQFQISFEDLFPVTFTADELGINKIIADGSITQEAKDAALSAVDRKLDELDPASAVICLNLDTAYELYWHDKAEGHGTVVSYMTESFAATGSTITVKGYVSVRMSVSQDYAVQSFSQTGENTYAEYEVDTQYGINARLAAENAQAIITANRNKSDEEKLEAYRDAVCTLTDYNFEVGDDDPYGDPWQLVWVFDGDPDTQVVCEGYAKAFQYLCDLGTKEATAITVQGQTSGPHMWNIVTMKGHNYLVDLTMCDSGYDLFMKGCPDGNPDTGYVIRHDHGTSRYIYNEMQNRTRDELTLYSMDYSEWKAIVEKTPDIQISSDVLYSGTVAMARLLNEAPELMPSGIVIHRITRDEAGEIAEETTDTIEPGNGQWRISSAGEYDFSVIRDGVESSNTGTVILTARAIPDGPAIRLPAGSEVCAEAFFGDSEIILVEAEDCILREGAFAGSGAELVCLGGNCTVEPGALDNDTILCIEDGSEWIEGYRFVVSE